MSRSVVVVAALVGCNDAITLAIDSDRPVPQAIDAICVGVADVEPGGGHFGRGYRLVDELAALPQTLRLEPGGADAAWAWVRGDRGGVPVARAGARTTFGTDLTLPLDACERGAGGPPAVVGAAAGPANARLVVSHGAGGALVLALGDPAAIVDASRGALVARALALPAGPAIAADVDGDCDDDVIVAPPGAPLEVWTRTGTELAPHATFGEGTAVTALAAADVDRDGFVDLVTGGGDALVLWRNDGAGGFTADPAALASSGRATSITALALGDLDGDGNADLVVGQGGGPLVAWLGGAGSFLPSDAVVPAVPLDVRALQLADVDGDFDPDLVVAIAGAPMRLYIDRQGLLEDQTFVRLAMPPVATAVAVGGWDGGCEPDLVIATATATESRRGVRGGALEVDGTGPAAGDAVLVDLDEDGDLDAVLATEEGVVWLAR